MDIDNADVCLSGGAIGADLAFGQLAKSLGHQTIHFSYAGHRTNADETEVVRLTEEQLTAADVHLNEANKSLHRSVPYKKPWIANLLRRNYYQVADSQRVYAVATLDSKDRVSGGTAWAVQMFIDLHGPDCEVYLFDQSKDQWFRWMRTCWMGMVGAPPRPEGIWTGIGSRDLKPNGLAAIERLNDVSI